jgi:hypothetical protein
VINEIISTYYALGLKWKLLLSCQIILHCIWQLPQGDDDFPTRWYLVFPALLKQVKTYPKADNVRENGDYSNVDIGNI